MFQRRPCSRLSSLRSKIAGAFETPNARALNSKRPRGASNSVFFLLFVLLYHRILPTRRPEIRGNISCSAKRIQSVMNSCPRVLFWYFYSSYDSQPSDPFFFVTCTTGKDHGRVEFRLRVSMRLDIIVPTSFSIVCLTLKETWHGL